MEVVPQTESTLTAAVIKANLTTLIKDSRNIFSQIKQEINKKSFDDGDSDDENAQVFSANNNSINKLSSLSERFEESAYIVMSCLDIATSRIDELEDALREKEETIAYQQNQILQLSDNQTNWSSTNPELLSLRRSHASRLDHLSKLTKELEFFKRNTKTLQRNEEQLRADCARASISLARNCDRLHSAYENEHSKCQSQAREIRELKKQLAKTNKVDSNPIQKQSLKMLQKQLRLLNITNKTSKHQNTLIPTQAVPVPTNAPSDSTSSSFSSLPEDVCAVSPVDEKKAIRDIKDSLVAEAEKFETGTWEQIIATAGTSECLLLSDILNSLSDYAEIMNTSSPTDDQEMVTDPPFDPVDDMPVTNLH